MFIAAGQLVEAVTDTTWDTFVRERLFEPLGMTHSSTSIRALPEEGNVATPHREEEEDTGTYRPIAWRNVDNLGGAGAINSTVRDMAQWLRMHLNEGRYVGQSLFEPATLEEMYAAQTVIPVSDDYKKLHPTTHFRAYGLGWFLQDHRGVKVVQHSGSLDGMRARVGLIPERDLGAVLFTNAPESDLLEGLLFRIFDRYLDAERSGAEPPLRDWSALLYEQEQEDEAEAQARRDSLRAERVEGTEPTLPRARYTGTYTHDAYGTARVTLEGGRLVLHVGPQFTGTLRNWHYDTFRTAWRDPTISKNLVTFVLGADGTVDVMKVKGWADFQRRPSED
jgi:CubicO group peptidase (beta-lactamase class C family)